MTTLDKIAAGVAAVSLVCSFAGFVLAVADTKPGDEVTMWSTAGLFFLCFALAVVIGCVAVFDRWL